MSKLDVVIGCFYGEEGKGTVIDYLAIGALHPLRRHSALRAVHIIRTHHGTAEGTIIHQLRPAIRAKLKVRNRRGSAFGTFSEGSPLFSLLFHGSLSLFTCALPGPDIICHNKVHVPFNMPYLQI